MFFSFIYLRTLTHTHACAHMLTHLECNSEHQHSEDESPEGPVPKHLQGKRGVKDLRLVATSVTHPYHLNLWVSEHPAMSTEE